MFTRMQSLNKAFVVTLLVLICISFGISPAIIAFFSPEPEQGGEKGLLFDEEVKAGEFNRVRQHIRFLKNLNRARDDRVTTDEVWTWIILSRMARKYGISASRGEVDAVADRLAERLGIEQGDKKQPAARARQVGYKRLHERLRAYRLTDSNLAEALSMLVVKNKLQGLNLERYVKVSIDEVYRVYRTKEKMRVRYAVIDADEVASGLREGLTPAVRRSVMRKIYEKRKSDFMRSESYRVEVLVAPVNAIRKTIVVSPSEIAAHYRANRQRIRKRQTRRTRRPYSRKITRVEKVDDRAVVEAEKKKKKKVKVTAEAWAGVRSRKLEKGIAPELWWEARRALVETRTVDEVKRRVKLALGRVKGKKAEWKGLAGVALEVGLGYRLIAELDSTSKGVGVDPAQVLRAVRKMKPGEARSLRADVGAEDAEEGMLVRLVATSKARQVAFEDLDDRSFLEMYFRNHRARFIVKPKVAVEYALARRADVERDLEITTEKMVEFYKQHRDVLFLRPGAQTRPEGAAEPLDDEKDLEENPRYLPFSRVRGRVLELLRPTTVIAEMKRRLASVRERLEKNKDLSLKRLAERHGLEHGRTKLVGGDALAALAPFASTGAAERATLLDLKTRDLSGKDLTGDGVRFLCRGVARERRRTPVFEDLEKAEILAKVVEDHALDRAAEMARRLVESVKTQGPEKGFEAEKRNIPFRTLDTPWFRSPSEIPAWRNAPEIERKLPFEEKTALAGPYVVGRKVYVVYVLDKKEPARQEMLAFEVERIRKDRALGALRQFNQNWLYPAGIKALAASDERVKFRPLTQKKKIEKKTEKTEKGS